MQTFLLGLIIMKIRETINLFKYMLRKRSLKKYIKKCVKYCIPHGIYEYQDLKISKNIFEEEYYKYKNECHIKGEIPKALKNYNTIVSVQGLGFSGSGAVLDFLCEMESCNVVGTVKSKEKKEDHNGLFECDFLRLAGGLFEVEKYIGSANVFQNDALLNRFVDYLNSFPLFKEDNGVRNLFFGFIDEIISFQINHLQGVAYNSFLNRKRKSTSIFFLRELGLTEYREICRNFLSNLFSYINRRNDNYLVFDQLLCDFEYDLKKYNEYIPDVKMIVVYRDPRDVYTFACKKNVEWIAHNTVDDFVTWYKIMTKKLEITSTKYLVVQFERLINDYENTTKMIMDYLGFKSEQHLSSLKKAYFDPELSKMNVCIWRKSNIPEEQFDYIKNSLLSYCYNV